MTRYSLPSLLLSLKKSPQREDMLVGLEAVSLLQIYGQYNHYYSTVVLLATNGRISYSGNVDMCDNIL